MTRKDTGWRPNGRANQYKGEDVWDHTVGPGEINDGEREPNGDDGDDDADVHVEAVAESDAETDTE